MIINIEKFIEALDEYIDPYEEAGVILALRQSCVYLNTDEDKYLDEVWEKLP